MNLVEKKIKLKEIVNKCKGYSTINDYLDICSIIYEFKKTLDPKSDYFYLDKLTIQKLVRNAPNHLNREQLVEELFELTDYINKTPEIHRGQIYWVDFGKHTIGSEQADVRPSLVIQNNIGNKHSPTLVVVAITSNAEKANNLPVHVLIERLENCGLESDSVVLAEQVRTVDKRRIGDYIGECPYYLMKKIEKAIKIEFDLYNPVDVVDFVETFTGKINVSNKFKICLATEMKNYFESNNIDYKNNITEYISALRFQLFNDTKKAALELNLARI